MTLSETYRAERLIDRRSRGRKARIAGRIIGFGLMACLLVAIRTDPQLRAMVDDAALAVIGGVMSEQESGAGDRTDQHNAAVAELGLDPDSAGAGVVNSVRIGSAENPAVRHMPQSTVKIHRGGIQKAPKQ